MAKNGVNIFVIKFETKNQYVDSYGIAGVQWTDDIDGAFRFETYNEAERVVDEQGAPAGLYQILELLVKD